MFESAGGTMQGQVTLRPLAESDLDAVVSLDARTTGVPRRAYFERRRAASIGNPAEHLELAAVSGDRVVGWLLSRVSGGEFGRADRVVVLEALGVEPSARRAGIARKLLRRLEELARGRGVRAIVTQVDWRNHSMLRFLDGTGFTLARRHVLDRGIERLPEPSDEDRPADDRPADDRQHAPIACRALRASDLDAIVRIDGEITGAARPAYLGRKLDEVLRESAIAISLVAESDGFPVAFAMARVDQGDYGRLGSVASLDTLGVSPRFARRGFGRALLSQLLDNLSALRIDRIETEVARDAFGLLGFLYRAGFDSSPRLPFERRLAATAPSSGPTQPAS